MKPLLQKRARMATINSNPAMRPYPSQYVSRWTMNDGTRVTIRPIPPEDEPLMVKFHGTLSDRHRVLALFLLAEPGQAHCP